ncbi:tail tube initiator protein [Vibrio phage vB_VpaM_VPs20]|uniref:Tail tube initiator protein n=1 Tax=Vibrio phage vB_VpaM_VPs20 TaxID=2978980 RepID=A0A9X9JPP4_9CAUD|nr:tail tube initiator protein [Vibrio phage vB_VpaM_VPs20]UYD72126.1 tail tube initiator protein [Vibrio phage vB_VpaM_VPs20]
MANKLREFLIAWEENEKWNVLAFDAAITEQHSGAVQVTSYPVDSGFLVSDHAIRQNRVFEAKVLQSNFSMSVSTSRKDFKESFNELMAAVGIANVTYESTVREGRAKYDNESLELPFVDNPVTNAVATALLGQVSMAKVDKTYEVIDRLNQLGTLVHIITMRGIKQNCVIRSYTAMNNVNDSYSLPMQLVFEQLNVVVVNQPEAVPQSTNSSDGGIVSQEQSSGFSAVPAAAFAATALAGLRASSPNEVSPQVSELPVNYAEYDHVEVPYSTEYDTRFVYDNIEYTLGRLKMNEASGLFQTRLQWLSNNEKQYIESITLAAGTNLVAQYGCPLPSLVAANIEERYQDANTSEALRLYVIVDFDDIFVGG